MGAYEDYVARWGQPGASLSAEVPSTVITSLDAPLPWAWTDDAGHAHRADPDAVVPWPTLTYVAGPAVWCAECRDEHEDFAVSRWECARCGQAARPRTGVRSRRIATGPAEYRIDGEPVSGEQAAAWQAIRAETAARAEAVAAAGRLGWPPPLV